MKIYSIGHSNLSYEIFLSHLKKYSIENLIDVRSKPFSLYASWSKKKILEEKIVKDGISYYYFGNELGGLPNERVSDYYDRERNPLFVVAIQNVIDIAKERPTVIMCSEALPEKCHRKSIIGRHLVNRGWEVIHILRNGDLEIQQPMLL